MIKPTIGRVVLVHRGKSDQAEPALISYVWGDECINVGGFDRNGMPFNETSLYLHQGDDPSPQERYACWMPYQKQQAEKGAVELGAAVRASGQVGP